jgi:hypothetical protein
MMQCKPNVAAKHKMFNYFSLDGREYGLVLGEEETAFSFYFPDGRFFEDISILQFVAGESLIEGRITDEVREWIWKVIGALEFRQLMTFPSNVFTENTFAGISGYYTLHTRPGSREVFLTIPSFTLKGTLADFKSVEGFLRLLEGSQLIKFIAQQTK